MAEQNELTPAPLPDEQVMEYLPHDFDRSLYMRLTRNPTTLDNMSALCLGLYRRLAAERAAYHAAEQRANRFEKIAAESRTAGRAEALEIFMRMSPEDAPGDWDEYVICHGQTQSGEYYYTWDVKKLRDLFQVPKDGAPFMESELERLDGLYWKLSYELIRAEERAAALGTELERLLGAADELVVKHAAGKGERWNLEWERAHGVLREHFDPWREDKEEGKGTAGGADVQEARDES